MVDKVSVIVPIYNAAEYLAECLDSIGQQEYENIEVILIDDGSKDNSGEIAQKYAEIDSRIIYKRIENSGVSVARNTGIQLATSNLIVFVDSDDTISPYYVSKLAEAVQGKDFAVCGYRIFNQDTQMYREMKCPAFSGNIRQFGQAFYDYIDPPYLLGPCFKIFRMDIIKEHDVMFPTDLSYGEDAMFVLEYIRHIHSVACISDMEYTYRQHGSATLNTVFRQDKIDINYMLNSKIVQIAMQLGDSEAEGKGQMWLFSRYLSYINELGASSLPYVQKRRVLFSKEKEYRFMTLFTGVAHVSIPKRLVLLCVKCRCFLPIYLMFKIRKA